MMWLTVGRFGRDDLFAPRRRARVVLDRCGREVDGAVARGVTHAASDRSAPTDFRRYRRGDARRLTSQHVAGGNALRVVEQVARIVRRLDVDESVEVFAVVLGSASVRAPGSGSFGSSRPGCAARSVDDASAVQALSSSPTERVASVGQNGGRTQQGQGIAVDIGGIGASVLHDHLATHPAERPERTVGIVVAVAGSRRGDRRCRPRDRRAGVPLA